MKTGFVQTTDLVRFHVRGSQEAIVALTEAAIEQHRAGRDWFSHSSGPFLDEPEFFFAFFYVAKESVPRVLDILAKHGVERVEKLE